MSGLAAIVGGLGLSAQPAGAVAGLATGHGAVDGSVTITSPGGIDTTPRQTTYGLSAILIQGHVTTTTGGLFIGCIATIPITGGFGPGPLGFTWPQGGETTLGTTGNVNSFTLASASCPAGVANVGTLSGTCSSAPGPYRGVGPFLQGGYLRVGQLVYALVNCLLRTNGGVAVPASIEFHALFLPPPGQNGVTVPITSATLVGDFSVNGG